MSTLSDPNSFDKPTEKRIHEHLANEEDKITEEDIRNVRTDVPVATDETLSEEEKKTVHDDRDPRINSVWGIEEAE